MKQKPLAWADEIIYDLKALFDSEMITENDSGDALIRLDAAICAVEEAEERRTTTPAAPVQEPMPDDLIESYEKGFKDGAAQRQWVGLTGDEREQIYQEHYPDSLATTITAVENKLKEKNT